MTPGFVDAHANIAGSQGWVNIVGANGEIVFTSELHSVRYSRRKARRLARLLGFEYRDKT